MRNPSPRTRGVPSRTTRSATLLPVVVGVGDLVKPLRGAAEPDVDLHQRLAGRRAVPVHHVRPGIVALANPELAHCRAALLGAHPALLDQQQLTVVVTVPEGPRARLEMAARGAQLF